MMSRHREFSMLLRVLVVFFISGAAALAGDLQLIEPIHGFSIRPVAGRGALYGASDVRANWRIAQWNNPGRPLKDFGGIACPTNCYDSNSDAAQVILQTDKDSYRFSLKQDGTALPCERKGKPVEFDLLASPTQMRTTPIAQMTALRLSLRFVVNEAKELEEKSCTRNIGQVLAALVMRNDHVSPTQVFFYQLSLFRLNAPTTPVGWWAPGVARGGGLTKRFGFRDSLASFDKTPASVGADASYEIDLLPRLKQIIAKGEHGLDTDINHWQLRSAYFGQHIWGNVAMSSTWERIDLRAVVAD
jgi:hypothetical protein